jgi:hypothetical protein
MATTTNYSWTTPDNTAYVKDGASAIRTLGSSVDTTLYTALGGAYPGLRLVKKQTIGSAVSSVNVTSAFSATYENYKIIVSGGVGSVGGGANLALKLGASAASYDQALFVVTYATAGTGAASGVDFTSFPYQGHANTNNINFTVDLTNPFLAKYTTANGSFISGGQAGFATGTHKVATSYTDFTITPASGTLTGGTIYVYGYGAS